MLRNSCKKLYQMKFSFYLDKRRADSKGKFPLKIRVSCNSTTAMISLGIYLEPRQFNPMTERIEQHPNKQFLNNFITRRKLDCEEAGFQIGRARAIRMTAMQVKNEVLSIIGEADDYEKANERLFIVQFNAFMETKTKKSTKEVYQYTLRRLEGFSQRLSSLTFEDIDIRFLNAFVKYLEPTSVQNSINIHLRNIRAVFNYAIENEVTTAYPFKKMKIRAQRTKKRALTLEQIRRINSMQVEDYLRQYRDIFMLSFFLIGINVVDLVRLRYITDDGRVEFARAKTDRGYSIKVEPEAMAIIERYRGKDYLLNIMDRYMDYINYRKRLNDNLKRLCPKENVRIGENNKKFVCGEFPMLSSYWARHTWATIASNIDIPKDTIAHALGHGEYTITDIYIDFDQKKVDDANRKVIDYVLYGK